MLKILEWLEMQPTSTTREVDTKSRLQWDKDGKQTASATNMQTKLHLGQEIGPDFIWDTDRDQTSSGTTSDGEKQSK